MFIKSRKNGNIKGLKVSNGLWLTHVLFVDDVIVFGHGSVVEWRFIKGLLNAFCCASGLAASFQKSTISFQCDDEFLLDQMVGLFPFKFSRLKEGIKYIGFFLKPDGYTKKEWRWVLL